MRGQAFITRAPSCQYHAWVQGIQHCSIRSFEFVKQTERWETHFTHWWVFGIAYCEHLLCFSTSTFMELILNITVNYSPNSGICQCTVGFSMNIPVLLYVSPKVTKVCFTRNYILIWRPLTTFQRLCPSQAVPMPRGSCSRKPMVLVGY